MKQFKLILFVLLLQTVFLGFTTIAGEPNGTDTYKLWFQHIHKLEIFNEFKI